MFVKLGIVGSMFCLSVVVIQATLNCKQFDFNDRNALLQFESCSSGLPMCVLKSYKDVLIQPLRSGTDYYLSNNSTKLGSCVRTKETYSFDNSTEIVFTVFLKGNSSEIADSNHCFVGIELVNVVDGTETPIDGAVLRDGWQEITLNPTTTGNFKINILTWIYKFSNLSIEYLDIVNPNKTEVGCMKRT